MSSLWRSVSATTLWDVRRKVSSEAEEQVLPWQRPGSKRILQASKAIVARALGGEARCENIGLKRSQGFFAVRSDGRPLGRVKRVENGMDGTFLRLAGVRARTIPLAWVETVWPGASLLLISDVEVDESSRLSMRSEAHRTRPAWEDETLPWWELVPEAPNSSRYSNLLMVGAALSTTIA